MYSTWCKQRVKAYPLYDPIAKKIIFSRDVVFEEEAKWDWSRDATESRLEILDLGEEKPAVEAIIEQNNSGNSVDIEQTTGRDKRQPAWMQDYESGGEISDEEENMAMFSSHDVPVSFEEAVVDKKMGGGYD